MRDLSIDFLGFKCKNPFFLAASPVARTGDMVSRAFEAGWGGVMTKSVAASQDLPDHGLSPRFVGVRSGGVGNRLQRTYTGLGNIDFRIDMSVKETFAGFERAKVAHPDHMLVTSIKCNFIEDEWKMMAKHCVDAGGDAIELCLSCPDNSGLPTCCSLDGTKPVLEWVKAVTDLPVIVKMSAHVDSIGALAKAAFANGADAVSGINTIKAIGGLNLYTNQMIPNIEGHSSVVGLGGGMIKPVAEYCVYEMARANPGKPISGIGGVTCGVDALEFLLLGARTVQVASHVMFEGYELVEDLQQSLSTYLEKTGAASVEDIIGTKIDEVYPATSFLSRKQQLRAWIDPEKCIGCGRCHVACRDGAYQAIDIDADRQCKVDREKCVGCGLCRIVCPVPGAIRYSWENDETQILDELM